MKNNSKIIKSVVIALIFGLGLLSNVFMDFRPPTGYNNPKVATAIIGVDSTNLDGTYGVGEGIYITVTFSEAVNVSGVPQLVLETGAIDAVADHYSGNVTTILVFYFLIQPGHVSSDLDYISTNALSLNGGGIINGSGDAVDLTLPAPGSPGSLGFARNIVIDTEISLPFIIGVSANNLNGTYGIGEKINITITFSETMFVTGNPQICLETGTIDRIAGYTWGSSSNQLGFIYIIQGGDSSTDLDYNGTNALFLNGGTIKNVSGVDANLTLPAPGSPGSLAFARNIVINAAGSPPAAPTFNIIVDDPDPDGDIDLYWCDVVGATEYHVYRYSAPITMINGSLTNVTTVFPANITVYGVPDGLWYFVISSYNASGESGPSNCLDVTVTSGYIDTIPQVNFFANVTYITAGMRIQFYNYTIDGNAPLSFQWNFGDGSGNSTEVNPIHQYLRAGKYWPILTVTDFDGDTNSTQPILINVTGGCHHLPGGFDPVNDTMDCNLTAGFNHNVVLHMPHDISISILLNTTSSVVVTIASWRNNPSHVPPPFQSGVEGFYFALEVNDTNLISFPISITIPLPRGLPVGSTIESMLKLLQVCTWNTTQGWVGENFEISVNLKDGTMTIKATHLSIFAVGIKPEEDTSLWFWIGISIAAVGLIGAVLAIIKMRGRKKKPQKEKEIEFDLDWD